MQSKKGYIFEIQRLSTEDGPGIRTTVFFKQCPLKCIWCHNPESITKKVELEWFAHKCIGCQTCIQSCPESALSMSTNGLFIDRQRCQGCGTCSQACPSGAIHIFGEYRDLDVLVHEVVKDLSFFQKSNGGVTVSGGEPSLQADFITDFLHECKVHHISTALDTCGLASRAVLEQLIPDTDLVLLDIKEIDPHKHQQFTGVSNALILDNAKWLAEILTEQHKQLWIRTPLIPGYTATEENIRGIAEFIVIQMGNMPERWDLLAFNNLCEAKYARLGLNWPLKGTPLMLREEMEKYQNIAQTWGIRNVHWTGLTKTLVDMKSQDSQIKETIPKSNC